MKAAIYARVSTEDQAREGYSIENQKRKLIEYCKFSDFDIYDIYIDEGFSAKNLNRPRMSNLIEDIKSKEIDVVVSYKLDRLTRSVSDLSSLLETFKKYNTSYKSATEVFETETAMGRMFIYMVGVMAAWERENIAERVSLGLEGRARSGKHNIRNGVLGYKVVNDNLIVNDEESQIVKSIFNDYIKGYSQNKIAKKQRENNLKTKRGGIFSPKHVSYILTNETYLGKIRYDVKDSQKIFEGTHEAIIELELFEKVKNIMKKRTKFGTKKYKTEDVIFNHVLYCKKCGKKYIVNRSAQTYKGVKKYYIRYMCNGRSKDMCDAPTISQIKLETQFLKYINKLDILSADVEIKDDERKESENELFMEKKRREKIYSKKNRNLHLLLDSEITKEEHEILRSSIDKELKDVETSINKLEKELENENKNNIKDIILNMKQITTVWDEFKTEDKGEFINIFIKRIEINDNQELKVYWL